MRSNPQAVNQYLRDHEDQFHAFVCAWQAVLDEGASDGDPRNATGITSQSEHNSGLRHGLASSTSCPGNHNSKNGSNEVDNSFRTWASYSPPRSFSEAMNLRLLPATCVAGRRLSTLNSRKRLRSPRTSDSRDHALNSPPHEDAGLEVPGHFSGRKPAKGNVSDSLMSKITEIGSFDTIMKLQDLLGELRGRIPKTSSRTPGLGDQVVICQQKGSSNLACKLQGLKIAIERAATNELLSKCLRRLRLVELVEEYAMAMAKAKAEATSPRRNLLSPRKRPYVAVEGTGKRGKGIASAVLTRFTDHLFPETIDFTKPDATDEAKKKTCGDSTKFENWRRVGKPWMLLLARFGMGSLLIMPDDISDKEYVSIPSVY